MFFENSSRVLTAIFLQISPSWIFSMVLNIPSVLLIQTRNYIWLSINKTVLYASFSQYFLFIFLFLKLPEFTNSRPDTFFERDDLKKVPKNSQRNISHRIPKARDYSFILDTRFHMNFANFFRWAILWNAYRKQLF